RRRVFGVQHNRPGEVGDGAIFSQAESGDTTIVISHVVSGVAIDRGREVLLRRPVLPLAKASAAALVVRWLFCLKTDGLVEVGDRCLCFRRSSPFNAGLRAQLAWAWRLISAGLVADRMASAWRICSGEPCATTRLLPALTFSSYLRTCCL